MCMITVKKAHKIAPYIKVTLSGVLHRIQSLQSLQDISIQRMKYILPEIVVLVYKPIHEPYYGLHSQSKTIQEHCFK